MNTENIRKSSELFKSGYNCSQAVLSAVCNDVNLDPVTAQAVAAGFGAGFGRKQMTCGAVTGALMVLGCRYFSPEDRSASKAKTYRKVSEFIDRFVQQHGTTECIRLLGVDLTNEDGYHFAEEHNLFTTRCEKLVTESVRILQSIFESDEAETA